METDTSHAQSQPYRPAPIPTVELQMDTTVYGKIIEAVTYFEENGSGNPIGIGAMCERSKQSVGNVQKVLYSLLDAGRLLPSFKSYCKSCGYLGDRAITVRAISDSCPCCYNKIMRIIEFWPADLSALVSLKKEKL